LPAVFRHASVGSGQLIVTSRDKCCVPELRQVDLAQPGQRVMIWEPNIASRSAKPSHIEFAREHLTAVIGDAKINFPGAQSSDLLPWAQIEQFEHNVGVELLYVPTRPFDNFARNLAEISRA
jgi:hypothetical protein